MYIAIRRYKVTSNLNSGALEQFRRQLQELYVPHAQGISGFHGYYVVNAGNNELLSISVFETKAGCDESTRKATEFVRDNKLALEFEKPQTIQGEVLTFAETAREVGAH
jgi:heme-degrading monooxygenase HmoA